MKKCYETPELEISVLCVRETISASTLTPDVEYDDIENWSPIVPPHP